MRKEERIRIWEVVYDSLQNGNEYIYTIIMRKIGTHSDALLENKFPEFTKYKEEACRGKTQEEIKVHGWFGAILIKTDKGYINEPVSWARRKEVVKQILDKLHGRDNHQD